MVRTFVVPLLAIAGVLLAVITVVKGSMPQQVPPPLVEPPKAPYASFVAGSGLVEASTQNIAIGTPVGGVVTAVGVKVGDSVKAGTPLFVIDDRVQKAALATAEANLAATRAQLARLERGTRPEELPPARARLVEAEAQLANMQDQLRKWEAVPDARAVSEDELSQRRFAVRGAEARVSQMRAEVSLLEAGTWEADLAVTRAQVKGAEAQVEAARVEVERLTVRAPVDVKVLQVNVRAGEFASAGTLATPLMVVGGVSPLHVRVDVDEHDAWRVQEGAEATAYVRGNKDISAKLTFVRFEPLVVPKRSLTGDSTERVDTRVLQVIYRFDRKQLPVFVGQQMDVFIESDPIAGAKFGVSPEQADKDLEGVSK